MALIWAGTDIGKTHHHCVVLDGDGRRLLSRRVPNDEPELLTLLADVLAVEKDVLWAVDVADGMAALWLDVLLNHGQQVVYIPGLTVNRASAGYRGMGKTDARDATVIADQARMRRDLTVLRPDDELIAELRILTGRRADLNADRTRRINPLRSQLNGIFPALERSPDLVNHGPIILLSGYQTPAALRRMGRKRLETWLRNRKVRGAGTLAETAVTAAEGQHTAVPGERAAAQVIQTLANEVAALNEQIAEIDKLIATRFRDHEPAEVIASLPGIGPLLGAEFLAATAGDLSCFRSADHLASLAGVAPVPRDSGKVSGNLHRPRRYHRGLQGVFYTSALMSIRYCEESRRFYERKRAEGKRHIQAVLALARRRVNVLWALIHRPLQRLRRGRCRRRRPGLLPGLKRNSIRPPARRPGTHRDGGPVSSASHVHTVGGTASPAHGEGLFGLWRVAADTRGAAATSNVHLPPPGKGGSSRGDRCRFSR